MTVSRRQGLWCLPCLALFGCGDDAETEGVGPASSESQPFSETVSAQEFSPNTVSSILEPFVGLALSSKSGRPEPARAELHGFEQALDGLRQCLEAEKCQDVVEDLLHLSESGLPGLESRYTETLKQAIFLRITRPLPHYFEGVRRLWLGDQDAAVRSFRRYLKLLPEADPLSKAHEFLASVVSAGRGKSWPSLADRTAGTD